MRRWTCSRGRDVQLTILTSPLTSSIEPTLVSTAGLVSIPCASFTLLGMFGNVGERLLRAWQRGKALESGMMAAAQLQRRDDGYCDVCRFQEVAQGFNSQARPGA